MDQPIGIQEDLYNISKLNLSRQEKLEAMVQWWRRWDPSFRQDIINEHCVLFDIGANVTYQILITLESIIQEEK